ncbi:MULTISPECIES: TraR/DksA C4-type zinc finger protein [Roseivirga]|jgi:RNA polymerase-binding transcription factor DksA|uniref:Molecular chaperone DnaK n=1 Tax=Roseivirga thermotolerans TaxID=1758176 RepID=A0ABQ3I1E6_9BACT|nr:MULTISPECIES: TraR/DksA C4-type zinc finger protein [Roseivirga]MEC7752863.1 TraR/DksA C4-type zinc finger protein [Bacteroidota bacterium]GHE54019.1 molecular chaperone DnaK [Roseivirga thermotolerans]|tara:strand:- start:8933 stop:9319 length:387 start_codon:yes stop_codon:yes gene_type:complete
MSQTEKTRYSESELKEFEALILDKIEKAKNELAELKKSLTKSGDTGEDITNNSTKVLEDGADTLEKENLNQLAARQQKFINNLENALIRIKNGTYGICVDTGKLISKERLKAVPHTMHSIEAKLAQRS